VRGWPVRNWSPQDLTLLADVLSQRLDDPPARARWRPMLRDAAFGHPTPIATLIAPLIAPVPEQPAEEAAASKRRAAAPTKAISGAAGSVKGGRSAMKAGTGGTKQPTGPARLTKAAARRAPTDVPADSRESLIETLVTLLARDHVDADDAVPVWRVIAAAEGTARAVPLAQLAHDTRQQVWDSVWQPWLTYGSGPWPTWAPWPGTEQLEAASATVMHRDFPHPDPAGWLQQQLRLRLTQTTFVQDDHGAFVDTYRQVLTFADGWDGTISTLLDATVAATYAHAPR
jgi:hypothetical protein